MNNIINLITEEAQKMGEKDLKKLYRFAEILNEVPEPQPPKTAEEVAAEQERKAAADRQAAAYKKWEEERKALENVSYYDRNETMKILGYQCMPAWTEQLIREYEEVKAAHREFIPYRDVYDLAYDMFSLGVIWGKRFERQSKRK